MRHNELQSPCAVDALKIFHLCLTTAEFLAGSAFVLYRLLQVTNRAWLRKIACGLVGFMSAFFIFVMILRTHNAGAWYLPLQAVNYTWVIFVFYMLVFILALDAFRLALHAFPRGRAWKQRRMDGIRRAYYSICILSVPLLITYGFIHFQHPVVKTVTMEVDKPVPDWRIVVVSDLHIGTMSASTLQRRVETINQLKPDLVLMLGDQFVIDWRDVEKMGYGAALGRLHAEKGIFLVNGNHEYYHGYPHNTNPEYRKLLDKWHFTVLEDSVAFVDNRLALVGRDDTTNRKRAALETLMADIPPDMPVIVMDHNPNGMASAERCGADIQLSGHQHNGQVVPLNLWGRFGSWMKGKLYYGYEKRGTTQYYVTGGAGSSGAPVRIGTDAEIVVLKVRPIAASHAGCLE